MRTTPSSVDLPGSDTPPALARAPAAGVVRSQAAARAERRAWVVLWLAFATFWALLASAVKLGADYVTGAEIDLPARVESSRGKVVVQSPGGPQSFLVADELNVGTLVAPERGASLALRLFDESRVTVQAAARVRLKRMEVGRFISRQSLALQQQAGPVRYQTEGDVRVDVPNGTVRLFKGGDATVWVDGDTTRVLVYDGQAWLEAAGSSVPVGPNQRGELDPERRAKVDPERAEQLLTNGDFSRHEEGWETHDVVSGRDVPGQRVWASGEIGARQVPALRIVRDSQTFAHGETGLRQRLDVNVSGYRHLYLQAWVRVDSARLSGGGALGSEYPMMLRVYYEGATENAQNLWVHGFYIANPDNLPVVDAQQIPRGRWYFYSVDLMELDSARSPYQLWDLEVMGQGHSYDARVADVRLVGD